MTRLTALAFLTGIAGFAACVSAQPTITSLGSGLPLSVSNPTGGLVYVGGSGVATTAPARWILNGTTLSVGELAGVVGGGYMSADGQFVATTVVNGPTRFAIGNATATSAVSPAFNAPTYAVPAVLAPSATLPAATEFGGARYSAVSNTILNMGVVPIIPFTPNPAPTIDIGNSGVFGTGSSGGSTSTFMNPNAISQNGRFIVALAYVCAYNTGSTAGTSISANTFYWRPVLWDAQGNAGAGSLTVLPTPFRTSTTVGANTRRRTGNPYAVSNDGLVIAGATEHNVGVTPGPDVDGGRFVVWRWNAAASRFDMTYLNTGVDASGFPKYLSSTPSALAMNAAGTIIVARGPDGITKWTWDGSSWGSPNVLGTNIGATTGIISIACPVATPTVTTAAAHGLAIGDKVYIAGNTTAAYNGMWQVSAVPTTTTFEFSAPDGTPETCAAAGTGGTVNKAASWLPASVYLGCGASSTGAAPPSLGASLAMTDDGNTIVGQAVYSNCGSFMSGGFIWHASDGIFQDWYDFNVAQGTPGMTPGPTTLYGPIGDGSPSSPDYTKGLPRLGYPTAISPDGSSITTYQGGTQRIPGAAPSIVRMTGGEACVPPAVTLHPSNVVFSLCSFSTTVGGVTTNTSNTIILNAAASGTLPLTFQWYKDTTPMIDGPTGYGSTVTGSSSFQMRINTPRSVDAGNYSCIITGCNGQTVSTRVAIVQSDTNAATPVNDTCSTAIPTAAPVSGVSTTNFNICGAYVNDGVSSCLNAGQTEIADVWYTFTPTFTGDARFQTCASGYDTTLQLLDACNGNVLACNNDVGARGVAGLGSACGSNRAVISRYPVVSGVQIYIRVGALGVPFSNSSTTGVLTISQAPAAPANDLCANATVVTNNSTTPFDLNEATDDFTYGTSTCSTASGDTQAFSNRDVWFRLNSPCGGTYTFSTCGSTDTNPMLHVMNDCGGASLLACSDNVGSGVTGCTSNQARISNLVVSPGSVLIRVSQSGTGSPGTAANSGSGNLIITGTDVPCLGACCSGATCSFIDASACTGANTRFVGTGAACNTAGNGTTPCCFGDFNQNGNKSVQDLFDYLAAWFALAPQADTNHNGVVSVQDLFDYLALWFGNC